MSDKLFKIFKSGDSTALYQILEQQRPLLYDYILRMTGQIAKAIDTTDEVFESLVDARANDFSELSDLRSCLYVTARRFNADTWNADTSKLMNGALESTSGSVPENSDQTEKNLSEQESELHKAFIALDQAIRILPGAEREAVLLRSIHQFDAEQVSEIMVCSEMESESLYLKGMQHIDAECSGIVQLPETTLLQLPLHPMPQPVTQATVNLSVMMNDIKSKPVGLFTWHRVFGFLLSLILIVLLVALSTYIWLGPEIFVQFKETLLP